MMTRFLKRAAVTTAIAAAFSTSVQAAEVETKGGLKVKSDDGQFAFQIGGRMHFDGYFFDNDANILNENGADIRRLRLTSTGTMYGVWEGKIEVDFRNGRSPNGQTTATVLRDAWLAYSGFPVGKITLGHLKVPMGLDELTSSNYIWFIERASPVSLITQDAHRRGLQLSGQHQNSTYAIMAYDTQNRTLGINNTTQSASAGLGIAGRATFAPIKDKTQTLHLGLSAAQEFDAEGFNTAGDLLSTRYEMNLADSVNVVQLDFGPSLNNNNDIKDGDEQIKYGAELAYVNGPFSGQAEYIWAEIDSDAVGDPEYGGWYVAGSWFLTGESRPYRQSNGTFDRIKPNSSSGAWELLARYSVTEGKGDFQPIDAEIKNITAGVNYYVNPNIRFMLNYIMSDIESFTVAHAAPPAVTPPVFTAFEGKPNAIALRAQFDF